MLKAVVNLPTAHRLLPYVKMWYGTTSQYIWHDAQGQPHVVEQGEGGEQGDSLMPALFSIGMAEALKMAQERLEPGEFLLAYLDDVYLLTTPGRARTAYDIFSDTRKT